MKINTALILCAGYGKRLNPITLNTPKPLLKLKNLSMIESCIDLIISLNIKKVLINTFYLKEQFFKFFENKKYKIEIKIIEDGNNILNTGGGVLNMVNQSDEKDFLIFNPDTLWNERYNDEINSMINLYFSKKLKNILLLVNKNLSFDKNLKGDFNLENNLITNQENKNYIYTGCQILNKSILINKKLDNFPIYTIWNSLIENKQLSGFESTLDFYHLTNLEVFNKLKDL
ncbi:sugar phosphate nucleotidyltransferase [Candidatus Pelagibacter sp.]|nr:sugar phosphate nucleotidyltransferase [Candidatus Pelagibacter sp.]